MANIFSMLKNASAMQSQMKKIQKDLANKIVERREDGITVAVKGDMTVERIVISPELLQKGGSEKLQKSLVKAVNSALDAAKNEASAEMTKMASDMGLGGLLGSMQ